MSEEVMTPRVLRTNDAVHVISFLIRANILNLCSKVSLVWLVWSRVYCLLSQDTLLKTKATPCPYGL
jgi:hypothetical protein